VAVKTPVRPEAEMIPELLNARSVRSRRVLRTIAAVAGFTVTTIVLWWYGYIDIFTRFSYWDDEGTLLITLHSYLRGFALYDQMFTQYGPAYYSIFGPIFSAPGMSFDHDHARMVALSCWSISALMTALSVTVFTRNILLGLVTQVLVFRLFVTTIGHEPMHPGVLTSMLLSFVCLAFAVPPRFQRGAAIAVGALVALLALTKINVGGFAVLAITLVATTSIPWVRKRPVMGIALVLLHAAVPGALMNTALSKEWAWRYFVLVTLAIILLGLTLLRHEAPLPGRYYGYAMASAVVTGSLVIADAMWRGTTLMGVIRGVILDPLAHPGVITIPLYLPPHDGKLEVFSVVLFAAAALWQARRPDRRWADLGESLVRLFLGGLILFTASGVGPQWRLYFFIVPLLWLAAFPPPPLRGPAALLAGRGLLAAVAVFQTLHAYPVAGNQVMFGTFLLLPAGSIVVYDGLRQLARSAEGLQAARWIPAVQAVILAAAIPLTVLSMHNYLAPEREIFRTGRAPALIGTTRLRLPDRYADKLEWVTTTLRRRCSTFVSYPGLSSFYLFTGKNPPTTFNVGSWMYLISEERQQEIVDRIRDDQRACLVRSLATVEVWSRGRPVPQGPLLRYMNESFQFLDRRGHYEIWVKRSSDPRRSGSAGTAGTR
jgi:hypothetical protein